MKDFIKFAALVREKNAPEIIGKDRAAKVYRAHARYKVAKHFKTLRISAGSDALVRGYSEGLRLFLCYTAAEAMGSAIGHHVSRWVILDTSLDTRLRRLSAPLLGRADCLKDPVRKQVASFVAGEHDNIRVVASALRHLIAHGDFTPTGTGVMTKSGAEVIYRLGNHLLAETERQFAAWFEKLTRE